MEKNAAAYIKAFTEMARNMGHDEKGAAEIGKAYGEAAARAESEQRSIADRTPSLLG